MQKESVETYLSKFPGAESGYPFGPEALVFKVMGKMFALVSQLDETPRVTLKCIPAEGAMLTDKFTAITPGYYMNKKHWITISLTSELGDSMIEDLASSSYKLVVAKLKKSEREQLQPL